MKSRHSYLTEKAKKLILASMVSVAAVAAGTVGFENEAKASSQVPELTVYEKNGSVKIEWAIDILDSNLLTHTSFENGQEIPFIMTNGFSGNQSISSESAYTGSKSLKVMNTVGGKGNAYYFPATQSDYSEARFPERRYMPDGTYLSVSLKAKTTNRGVIKPFGRGGPANKQITFEELDGTGVKFEFAKPVVKGQNYFYVTNPSHFKKYERYWVAGRVSTTGDYNFMYIESVNISTGYVKLNSSFTQDFAAGSKVLYHRQIEPVIFPIREVTSQEGWKTLNFNAYVNGGEDYDTLNRGFEFWLNTLADGTLYIDDIKFGYATRAQLYRNDQLIYDGYLSDFEDKQAIDKNKPNKVSNVRVSFNKGKPKVEWDAPVDNGTTYNYKIRAIDKNGTPQPFSANKSITIKSNIKGYSVVIDKNPTTEPNNTINTTTPKFELNQEINGDFYIHIKAIDNAGNASETQHIKVSDLDKPEYTYHLSNTELTNQDVSITVNASDKGLGIKGIHLPNGQFVYEQTVSYVAKENGLYKFILEDNVGNQTELTVPIENIDKIPPIIDVAKPNFILLDDETEFTITGQVIDEHVEGAEIIGEFENESSNDTVENGLFTLTFNGSNVHRGFHKNKSISMEVNDNADNFTSTTIDGFPVIKVEDAEDYLRALQNHDPLYENWSIEQHEAFYHAYHAVMQYELTRLNDDLTEAINQINNLKDLTFEDSELIVEWQNRLDFVSATVAIENAEQSLMKADYENAKHLVTSLEETNKQPFITEPLERLIERLEELGRYHTANDYLVTLENNVTQINWSMIDEARTKIEQVQNTTNKNNLHQRLETVIKHFMSSRTTITIEDLTNFDVENVVPENEEWYNEFLEVFQPLGENANAQHLVNFVNALRAALADMTPTAVTQVHESVPNYAKTELAAVLNALDDLLHYRQVFANDEELYQSLHPTINSVAFENTKTYMHTIKDAMKEVIEYNVTHDENEKQEGQNATQLLWNGQLKSDMQAYLDNGIPDILIIEDAYEFINDGTITVIGSIQDTDDSFHTVEISFNRETKSITTTDKHFKVTFSGLDIGVYDSEVSIIVKDSKTTKHLTIKNKPIVTVSDTELFKQFVYALENDTNQHFTSMDKTVLTALTDLFERTHAADINTSSREMRDLENLAQSLSGKEEGELEKLVKSIFSNIRLEWLIHNYEKANIEDFHWAGVTGVTLRNITDLKQIITDYLANGGSGVPQIEDYENWLNIQHYLQTARNEIGAAEKSLDIDGMESAIARAEEALSYIPEWISEKPVLIARLDSINNFVDTVRSVEQAENTLIQEDKDIAQGKVDSLPNSTTKDSLQIRLDHVQIVIDAISAVEQAEITLDELARRNAEEKVALINENHPKKEELLNRLLLIDKLKEAIAAVEVAESTKTQKAKDDAQSLVEALPDSTHKADLLERLKDLQNIIDEKSREELALEAVEVAEDTLLQSDKDKAQELVDSLQDGTVKESLQKRLDTLQLIIQVYERAKKAVEEAETTKSQTTVDSAQVLIDELPDSRAKSELQERLDVVKAYIQAERAVSRAEETLLQAHKDLAQQLVDALPPSVEKDLLQERLDAIQLEIDKKPTDLLDKIISDLDNVTPQELADYTGEIIFEELMPEYLKEIGKYKDSITKEYVIKIVRLLNKLEIAKRSMKEQDIQAYNEEFAKADLPIQIEYPSPNVLYSIANYLEDDSSLERVIQEIAAALNTSADTIRIEIEEILKEIEHEEEIPIPDEPSIEDELDDESEIEENDEPIVEMIDISMVTADTVLFYIPSAEDDVEVYISYLQDYADEFEKIEISSYELQEILEIIHAAYTQSIQAEEKVEGLPESAFKESLKSLITPRSTIGEETALVRSLIRVASLDNFYISSTAYPAWEPQNKDHAEYLFKAFYALASVKGYMKSPSELRKNESVTYIKDNLYDGAYKELLLSYLGIDISVVGDDGNPDLTPVYPRPKTEPTPEIPLPETPKPTKPSDKGSTGGGSSSNQENTPGKEEQSKEQISVQEEGNTITWTIKNPQKEQYELTANGIQIIMPIYYDSIKDWQIIWEHLRDEYYRLSVVAGGKQLSFFERPIKLAVKHNRPYMLKVVDGKYKAIPYHKQNDVYHFEMNTPSVVYFSPDKITFTDIENVFSKEQIEELASRYIVKGSKGKYHPHQPITRAQFAVMIARALDLEATGDNPFIDTAGQWFEKEVQALWEAGIIKGTSPTTFEPYEYITRQQAALMIDRVLRYTGVARPTDIRPTFNDSEKISDEAQYAVGTLQALGIVTGKEGHIFDASGHLTRAQMAKMLTLTLKYAKHM